MNGYTSIPVGTVLQGCIHPVTLPTEEGAPLQGRMPGCDGIKPLFWWYPTRAPRAVSIRGLCVLRAEDKQRRKHLVETGSIPRFGSLLGFAVCCSGVQAAHWHVCHSDTHTREDLSELCVSFPALPLVFLPTLASLALWQSRGAPRAPSLSSWWFSVSFFLCSGLGGWPLAPGSPPRAPLV